MNDEAINGVHWSFWVISVVALIWNAMGVMNFFMQMNPDVLAKYSETARSIVESQPTWASGAFAIGVFGGALGSVLLLLRKSVAVHLFIASLIGVIVTITYTLSVDVELGPGEVFG